MEPTRQATDAVELFEAYHDQVYRYVLDLVKNPAEAEDLSQDTFLRAYHRRDSLRDPRAVVGWLYRIATNVSLDHLRSHRSEISIDESKEGSVLSGATAIPSALESIERDETSRCVQRCLEFLPDSYRAVILLHEAHSLTHHKSQSFWG